MASRVEDMGTKQRYQRGTTLTTLTSLHPRRIGKGRRKGQKEEQEKEGNGLQEWGMPTRLLVYVRVQFILTKSVPLSSELRNFFKRKKSL